MRIATSKSELLSSYSWKGGSQARANASSPVTLILGCLALPRPNQMVRSSRTRLLLPASIRLSIELPTSAPALHLVRDTQHGHLTSIVARNQDSFASQSGPDARQKLACCTRWRPRSTRMRAPLHKCRMRRALTRPVVSSRQEPVLEAGDHHQTFCRRSEMILPCSFTSRSTVGMLGRPQKPVSTCQG